MAVIAIYKSFASGGRELGRILAKKLGYHYVDKSLFQKIAEVLHVSEGTLESFEHSRMYRMSNLFSNLFTKSYIQRIVGFDRSVVEEKEYQNSLKKLIRSVCGEDYDSPLLFHLTINMGLISMEKAADIILSVVGSTI